MTFKELLNSVTFEEVAPHILGMYPDAEHQLKWYKIHFDMLRLMIPKRHADANSDVCHITLEKWTDGGLHLDAHPMEGDLWEHSLTKEIVIATDVKATNAEIAACCLWHTSFYGFVREHSMEYFRLGEISMGIKDRWDDSIYYKARAERYYSIIRRNGGLVPSIRELTPSKKCELICQSKKIFGSIGRSKNKIKRKRLFRRQFLWFYYERMMNIAGFIVHAIPALRDERNTTSIEQLCYLFQSDQFSTETVTSYADEHSNGAKYFCELLEMEELYPRLKNIVVILTTGERHLEMTEDEKALCKLLVGDCNYCHILLATDSSLGRQVRLTYATFNSKYPLINEQYEKEKER